MLGAILLPNQHLRRRIVTDPTTDPTVPDTSAEIGTPPSADVDPTSPAISADSSDPAASPTDPAGDGLSDEDSSATSTDAAPTGGEAPFDSEPGATDTASDPTASSTAVDGGSTEDAAQPDPSETQQIDATGNDGSGPSLDPTAANTVGDSTGVVDGKDGASADENQPTIDALPDPGVDPSTSLSPTYDGVPEALDPTDPDEEPDTAPVIVQPVDEEPTFVNQPAVLSITGSTPRFRATKTENRINVQKAGWIGPEGLEFAEDDLEELIGLLVELKATELETEDAE